VHKVVLYSQLIQSSNLPTSGVKSENVSNIIVALLSPWSVLLLYIKISLTTS